MNIRNTLNAYALGNYSARLFLSLEIHLSWFFGGLESLFFFYLLMQVRKVLR